MYLGLAKITEMQYLFDADVYRRRRAELAQKVGEGLVLLTGNENSPINYQDNYFPFRQDSHFLYYCGMDMPGLNLVIDCSNGETTLYGDDVTIEHVVWMGPQPTLRELADQTGIENVEPSGAIFNKFESSGVKCLPPYRKEHFRLLRQLRRDNERIHPDEQLIRSVIAQREIKDELELVQIEQALEITREMHVKAMQAARAGIQESVLAGIAEGVAIANGCRLAYGAIVTRNGHILHNHDHYNVLSDGDLVLCDMGSENRMRYASDITRTFPVASKFAPRQKEIYEIVLEAEFKCINAVRPGQKFRDVHTQAARIIADGLGALGVMKNDPEEAVAAGAHALFFPHGLGHMMGLDVHDMEGLGEDLVGYDGDTTRSDQFGTAHLRLGKELQPGHVLTVEPGIYFIPALIDMWQSKGMHTEFINYDKVNEYRDFGGVRIEDNIVVTQSGHRVLGPEIPKSVEEIESLRSA